MEPQPPFHLPRVARDGIALVQLAVIGILIAAAIVSVLAIVFGITYSLFFA